jgi:DNA-directed RNA polymerase specialized sigma24 family protein
MKGLQRTWLRSNLRTWRARSPQPAADDAAWLDLWPQLVRSLGAEDAASHALLVLLNRKPAGCPVADRPLAKVVARHALFDAAKRRSRTVLVEQLDFLASAEGDAARIERVAWLRGLASSDSELRLTVLQRRVFSRLVEGCAVKQIAREIGRSSRDVRRVIDRVRIKITKLAREKFPPNQPPSAVLSEAARCEAAFLTTQAQPAPNDGDSRGPSRPATVSCRSHLDHRRHDDSALAELRRLRGGVSNGIRIPGFAERPQQGRSG